MAETMRPRTSEGSRKRTSALAGCTLTSTARGSQARNSASTGEAVARHVIHIAGPHRRGDELVAHRAAVDEEILALARRPVEGRQADEAREREARLLGCERQRVVDEILADDLRHARQPAFLIRRAGRTVELEGGGAVEREGDRRIGHGKAPRHVGHGLRLGAVALEELEPRRRRREEIARLDGRARRPRRGLERAFHPGVEADAMAARRAGAWARHDVEAGHRADRGQGLATEAERRDGAEIAGGELRGGVPLDREVEILGPHADAVVDDADQAAPARLHRDGDRAGTGVERILDQLLDDRGGALDHLARGDAIDEHGIETAHGHGRTVMFLGARADERRNLRRSDSGVKMRDAMTACRTTSLSVHSTVRSG